MLKQYFYNKFFLNQLLYNISERMLQKLKENWTDFLASLNEDLQSINCVVSKLAIFDTLPPLSRLFTR